jgi:hypothetical protein
MALDCCVLLCRLLLATERCASLTTGRCQVWTDGLDSVTHCDDSCHIITNNEYQKNTMKQERMGIVKECKQSATINAATDTDIINKIYCTSCGKNPCDCVSNNEDAHASICCIGI